MNPYESHIYSGGHHDLYRCKTLNISFKYCSKCKSRDSFKICSSWGFQNTPYMFKLIKFWLRYLRSKTNDMILKKSSKFIRIEENLMKTKLFVTKCLDFMIFSSIFINLLEFFRIISSVFDLKYLSQNLINSNMLGVFWNPQQYSKLSLDLHIEQHLR